MHIWIKQSLVLCALGLALWLLWGFWLLGLSLSVLLSVLLIALAAVLSSANYQLYRQRQKHSRLSMSNCYQRKVFKAL